ncbi:MAG: hypothetical protein ABIH63_00675 [archaeon]
MFGKKKKVLVDSRIKKGKAVDFKKHVKVPKPSSGIKHKLVALSKYLTFFALLLFFVFVVYLLVRGDGFISSTWVYSVFGVVAGLLVIINIYLVRKHSDRIKGFFSKFKKPKEKKVVGAVVDESKKVGKPVSKFKPKLMLFVVLFIFAVVAVLVLNSRGIVSFSDPYFLLSLGALFFISIIIVALRFYRYYRAKTEIQEKVSRETISVIKKSIVAKSSKYKTDLDRLYELVNEKGKLTLSDVAKGFNISIEMAEEWAKILESHNMITLNYPPFGEVELCKK